MLTTFPFVPRDCRSCRKVARDPRRFLSSRRQLIPGRCDNYQQRTCRSRGRRDRLVISTSYATNLLRTASSAQGCVRNPERKFGGASRECDRKGGEKRG